MKSSQTISVRNASGQVTHYDVSGPNDERAKILRQRIAVGELEQVSKTAKSGPPRPAPVNPDDSRRDEKGDVLSSVHGGGRTPRTAVTPAGSGSDDSVGDGKVPPRSGSGSGRDAWAAYAAENEVTVAEDASRDDIIAALDAAGVPTE